MRWFTLATGTLALALAGGIGYIGGNVGVGPLPDTGSGTRAMYVRAWQPYHEQDASGTSSYCVSSHAGTPLPPFINQLP